MKNITEKEMLNIITYDRKIFKKHTKSGVPVFFTTVNDEKNGKMQLRCACYNMTLTNYSEYTNR